MTAKPPKRFTSFRLSEECHDLLGRLMEHKGGNRTAVIEEAVRDMARAEGVLPVPGKLPKKSRKKSEEGA